MKKTIRLTETELSQLIKRMIQEVDETQYAEPSAELYASLEKNLNQDEDEDSMEQQVAEDWYKRKMYRKRLNEDDVVKKIKSCYSNSGKPFPTSCEKGPHPDCKQKIRNTATSFFLNNKNAQNDPQISKFWNCINKIDSTILQGMG